MFCGNCGKEIADGSRFCPYCGTDQRTFSEETALSDTPLGKAMQEAALVNDQTDYASQEVVQVEPEEEKGSRKIMIAAIITLILLIIAVVAGTCVFVLSKKENGIDGSQKQAAEKTGQDDVNEDEIPLYSDVQLSVVDLSAENMTPGEKAPGMAWDETLFYRLEDCDTTSSEDGQIARCRVTKTMMLVDGKMTQYEIYHDPDTDEIYKIVSICQLEDEMELVDYYYQNGKPNFMFERSDSVYTPTYATIDKVGERYYFNNDVMVRWRMIKEPGNIGEYTLAPTDTWYSQEDYFTEDVETRETYDAVEFNKLNKAYNTWNAVTADPGIGTVDGCVKDTAGEPVADATVSIYRKSDDVLLYRMQTGEDGGFHTYVYLDGSECYLKVKGDKTLYKSILVKGLNLTDNAVIHAYDSLVLHKLDEEEYPVHLTTHIANQASMGEDGNLTDVKLAGVTVNFREGSDARDGDIVLSTQTDSNGDASAKLPSGNYTAELVADGYVTTWLNVEITDTETYCDGWILQTPAEGQTAVVLTWDGEDADLDLTVFTPTQSTEGDMAHIGGGIMDDGKGNQLLSDNSASCEVMYLNTAEAGNYKIYVNDYTDSTAGNYTTDKMARLNVHIYIYSSTGLLEDYIFPAGQTGVVWEVAEVNNHTVVPGQRVYTRLEGKSWWTENKGEEALRQALEHNLGSYLSSLVEKSSPATVGNRINSICKGDVSSLQGYFFSDSMSFYPEEILYSDDESAMGCLSEVDYNRMLYSMTGNSILKVDDVADLDEERTVDGKRYFPVYGAAGWMGNWMELENPTITATGSGQWDVQYDAIYHIYNQSNYNEYNYQYQAGNLMFHVVADSASVFDGFRITGVDMVYSEFTKTVFDAYVKIIKELRSDDDYSGITYYLYDINDDAIPEFYADLGAAAYGGILYTYLNGKVEELDIGRGEGDFAEGRNFIRNDHGNMGTYSSEWYIITENGFEQIFNGFQQVKEELYFEDEWTDESFDYWIDDVPCTTEKYTSATSQIIRDHLGEEYLDDSYYGWKWFGEYNAGLEADSMISFLQDGWLN